MFNLNELSIKIKFKVCLFFGFSLFIYQNMKCDQSLDDMYLMFNSLFHSI